MDVKFGGKIPIDFGTYMYIVLGTLSILLRIFSIGLYKTQNYSRLSFQANDFFYSL